MTNTEPPIINFLFIVSFVAGLCLITHDHQITGIVVLIYWLAILLSKLDKNDGNNK